MSFLHWNVTDSLNRFLENIRDINNHFLLNPEGLRFNENKFLSLLDLENEAYQETISETFQQFKSN